MYGVVKNYTVADGMTEEDMKLMEMCPKLKVKVDIDADISDPDFIADSEPFLNSIDEWYLADLDGFEEKKKKYEIISKFLQANHIAGHYTLGYLYDIVKYELRRRFPNEWRTKLDLGFNEADILFCWYFYDSSFGYYSNPCFNIQYAPEFHEFCWRDVKMYEMHGVKPDFRVGDIQWAIDGNSIIQILPK